MPADNAACWGTRDAKWPMSPIQRVPQFPSLELGHVTISLHEGWGARSDHQGPTLGAGNRSDDRVRKKMHYSLEKTTLEGMQNRFLESQRRLEYGA